MNQKKLLCQFKGRTLYRELKLTEFIIIVFLLLFAFLLRVIHLNFNTPFVDEASSIVIGKLGMFNGDWWSYNASNWLSGSPYVNPVLSAIAYVSGGIIGSRLLSVFFGVITIESVMAITILISLRLKIKPFLPTAISGFVLTSSATSIFVSQMSTYDIKSFCFLFASILFLLWAETVKHLKGKWYFFASICLILALMAKIIVAIYIPFLLIYSFLTVYRHPQAYYYWKRYYFVPLSIALLVYGVNYLPSVLSFAKLQTAKEKYSLWIIFSRAFQHLSLEIIVGATGAVGMVLKKQTKLLLLLVASGLWIILTHIITQRAIWTMDKHIYISVVSLAIIAGIGLSNLITFISSRQLKSLALVILFFSSIFFVQKNYQKTLEYEHYWEDSSAASSFLISHVKPGQRILSETGAAMMLSLYSQNHPTNLITFDWLEYGQKQGKEGYYQATVDDYFDYIELIHSNLPKDTSAQEISNIVRQNISRDYLLVFNNQVSEIYQRNY